MSKESAIEEIVYMIDELDTCTKAASDLLKAVAVSDPNGIKEALATLNNYIDGHWHKLVIGAGGLSGGAVFETYEFLHELENPQAAAGASATEPAEAL